MRVKVVFLILCGMLLGLALVHLAKSRHASAAGPATGPQFDSAGNLVRPEGYRRWVFLSSGFGMSYSKGSNGNPQFTNVFVNPSSYEYFEANGKWPDNTIFVLEEYDSTSRGSINQSGSYQQTLAGLAVEVKDAKRFPDKWAYFGFEANRKTASAMTPSKNDCWNCHEGHGAVDHTFVQFYPEALKIARAKGTVNPSANLPK
jgi:Cytochrome P460